MAIYRQDRDFTVRLQLLPATKGRRERYHVVCYRTGQSQTDRQTASLPTREEAVATAQALWQEHQLGHLDAPDAPPATIAELIDKYVARTHRANGQPLSPATQRAYRTQLEALRFEAGPETPLSHLSRRHVERAIRVPKSPASKRSYLRATRCLIRWAMRQGWLDHDVTREIVVEGATPGLRPWLREEEIQPYLEACRPSHRIRSGLLLETGLRAGEAVAMRWEWVHASNGRRVLRVPADDPVSGFWTKSHRARAVPLSKAAEGWLEQAA